MASLMNKFKSIVGLLIATTAFAADTKIQTNRIILGPPSLTNKDMIFNLNAGAANPLLRANGSTGTLQFSTDGTNFSDIGSGAGGSSGVNMLLNPGFESGIGLDWSYTGGTFAAVTTGSNLLIGKQSATFTASSTGQSVQSVLHTVPNGLAGQACVGSMLYLGGSSNLAFEVVDGSSNVLVSQVLQPTTVPVTVNLPFLCPSSGSLQLKIVSTGSSAIIAMDQMFLGSNTSITQVSQAVLYGSTTLATCTGNFSNTSGSYSNYSGATGCTYVNTGNAQAPASSQPAISFASLPPGNYVVEVIGAIWASGTGPLISYQITDGTNTSREQPITGGSSGTYDGILRFSMPYTTGQNNITFTLQSAVVAGTGTPTAGLNSTGLVINVYRFPSQADLVVSPTTNNWVADFTQTAVATPYTASGSFIPITDAGFTSVINPGDNGGITVGMPCSAFPSTGTTCSSGTPEAGIVINAPTAGEVQVCAQYNLYVNSSSGATDQFQIYATADGSDTQAIVGSGQYNQNLVVGSSNTSGTLCDALKLPAAGRWAFKMFYTFNNSGGTTVNNLNQIHWIVKPVTQNIPAPVVVNSVINPNAGVTQLTSALVSGTAGGCSVSNQDGSWLGTCTRNAIGDYIIAITSGIFSSAPNCTVTSYQNVANITTAVYATSSSSIEVLVNQSGSGFDGGFYLLCVGVH